MQGVTMASNLGIDLYSPKEIAEKIENIGIIKAALPLRTMGMLGMLAGAFISFGALYFTLVASDASLGFALTRVLGGLAFSLGLILVAVAGAELFTGNNFLVMAWAEGRIPFGMLARNWAIVYVTNAIGALGMVLLVFLSHHADMNGGAVAETYVKIAAAKTATSFSVVFFKGVLCNALVCLAVWLATAGRSVTDKVLAIVFPVSAFVAAGFEHCIANMYFIPMGMLLLDSGVVPPGVDLSGLTFAGMASNLIAATLGNIFGGSILVAGVYYLTFRQRS
jgi:formate/nitrite transporter